MDENNFEATQKYWDIYYLRKKYELQERVERSWRKKTHANKEVE